jgi:citrate lyase beta subunit
MTKGSSGGTRLRRSLLFVPGDDPRKIERADRAGADTVILDLEDSVAPDRKADARRNVEDAIRASLVAGGWPFEIAVRVNSSATPGFAEDIAAVVAAGASAIVLPKAESARQVEQVVARVAAAERDRHASPTRLLLLVETPLGIARALELGSAPRVDALCFGHADFSAQMGLAEADASRGVVHHARCSLAIAARACGVAPIDCVALGVKDEVACREDAELGLRLGFDGKLCIHPRQVEIVNQVYTPSPAEVEEARRIVAAADAAAAEGRGVLALDGKMIDAPVVAAKRRVLERARGFGSV